MTVTIARPTVPQHFMVLKPASKRVLVRSVDGTLLAESLTATRLIESGKTIYDPVWYFPPDSIHVALERQLGTTHCPLKGDASYFSALGIESIAWSYETPLDFSLPIKGLIAFYGDKVIVEEHPL